MSGQLHHAAKSGHRQGHSANGARSLSGSPIAGSSLLSLTSPSSPHLVRGHELGGLSFPESLAEDSVPTDGDKALGKVDSEHNNEPDSHSPEPNSHTTNNFSQTASASSKAILPSQVPLEKWVLNLHSINKISNEWRKFRDELKFPDHGRRIPPKEWKEYVRRFHSYLVSAGFPVESKIEDFKAYYVVNRDKRMKSVIPRLLNAGREVFQVDGVKFIMADGKGIYLNIRNAREDQLRKRQAAEFASIIKMGFNQDSLDTELQATSMDGGTTDGPACGPHEIMASSKKRQKHGDGTDEESRLLSNKEKPEAIAGENNCDHLIAEYFQEVVPQDGTSATEDDATGPRQAHTAEEDTPTDEAQTMEEFQLPLQAAVAAAGVEYIKWQRSGFPALKKFEDWLLICQETTQKLGTIDADHELLLLEQLNCAWRERWSAR